MQTRTITATSATTDPEDTGQQASSKHLGSVDTLRGIAAVYVVCLHMTMIPFPHLAVPDWIRPLILSGGTGVAMFFVVSAFTLSISWFSRKDHAHPVRNFYLRRIFRIVPLFYILLTVMLLLDWHILHKLPPLKEIMLNVCLVFNLVPGRSTGIVLASWTIGVEMLFYLMFPLVIKVGSTPRRLVACFMGSLVLAALFYQGVQHSHLSATDKVEFFVTSLALQLPVFMLGMITYHIFVSQMFKQLRTKWLGGLLIATALIYYLALTYSGVDLGSVALGWSAPAWTLLVLGLVINPVSPIVNAVTRFYGRISYSVYLNHPIVVLLLRPGYARIYRHVPGPGLALLTCFVATFSVLTPWAYVSYRLIEQPGIRFGSRLIKSLDQPSLRY
jgi:peptidoglycan/LPS O-acetylase OafA/YrhL